MHYAKLMQIGERTKNNAIYLILSTLQAMLL